LWLLKPFEFALKIIKISSFSHQVKKEFILSKQILRSGTSIGADIEEALGGQSRKDFLHKIAVARKEAGETRYWLKLLRESELLEPGVLT
jgi:four helix bundle protein